MQVAGGVNQGCSGDGPSLPGTDRIPFYCNEILKRTECSGPISTIEFNKEGTHFAYGNADGIVSVVEMGLAEESEITHARHTCSKPYQSFVSHHPEFDVLKSQAIDERITIIRWLPRSAESHFLLSCNERTIKLWRLREVPTQSFTNMNFPTEHGCRQKIIIRSLSDIKVPVCTTSKDYPTVRVWNKKEYDRAHGFCITGLSTSIDRETFYSCDALRINLWNLEISTEVFSIMDRPLDTVDDSTHLITGLDCSNRSPSIFAYCTNRGSVRLHDMRQCTNCDNPSIVFDSLSPDEPNILTLFVNAISDVKMGKTTDRFVFTRDYLTVKVWDVHMPTTPVEVYPVQTQLRNHLSVLYESELLCDDFKLSLSSDDRFIISGSYNRTVKVFDRRAAANTEYNLVMQKEEMNPFVDPFRAADDLNSSASLLTDNAELPWPRRIVEDVPTKNLPDNSVSSTDPRTPLDVGCKWLQVSWRPGSYVAAVSHSDGIHLLEALC
ncbi:unnamed protein product [Calicophoron daubneyi]|uniref:Serine/threonine-protein phosphatase 2A 55 kDa regulatory subunit B n=1 Tax=Calicophoron daubneyi TaxID=300641 RepID=A0AAV2TPV2_CALDB